MDDHVQQFTNKFRDCLTFVLEVTTEGDKVAKIHLRVTGVDARGSGQTGFEYTHQTACGYIRGNVTGNMDKVDCKLCLRSDEMKHYHQINKTFSDSQGCY